MNVDWKSYLGPNTRIPHDVVFIFPEEEGSEDIGAHKVLLAMASEVFHGQFYGPMSESEADVLAVVDNTREAFNIMVEFIYNKIPNWDGFSKFELFFQVYKVADFYLLDKLKAAVEDAVKNFVITEANFQELSLCADRNGFFSNLADSVFESCASFLSQNFGSYEKILQFIDQYNGDPSILLKIMRLMKKDETSVKRKGCSFAETGFNYTVGGYYVCHDCLGLDDEESTICKFCIERCHSGHNVSGHVDVGDMFFCDCGAGLLRKKQPCSVIPE
eukprot:GFUD01003100.1.p1 GENE.GFUD01003100.1~~GFUD01003100.1.p1  ORF type:complete len:274 (-),score=60.48 GFUD01003100.1:44-865(-)